MIDTSKITDKLLFNDEVNGEKVQNMYQKVGEIKINNNYFIIYSFSNNIKIVEPRLVDGNIKYIIFDKMNTPKGDLNSTLTYIQDKVIINNIYENLENDIKSGKFSDKHALVKRIEHYQRMITNSGVEKQILDNTNSYNGNYDDFAKKTEGLLKMFDQYCKDNTNELNMQNISHFEVQDEYGNKKDYLKHIDANGNVELLDDTYNDKPVKEQFNDMQNKITALNMGDGLANAESTYNIMKKYVKPEVKLDSMTEKKENNLDQTIRNNAVVANDNEHDKNYTVSSDNSIYIDNDTKEVVVPEKTEDGMTVRKIGPNQNDLNNDSKDYEPKVVPSINQQTTYNNAMNETAAALYESNEKKALTGIDLDSLPLEKINEILSDEDYIITPEQRMYLEYRKSDLLQQETGITYNANEQQHEKVKTLSFKNKPNAYTNIFLIAIIMQLTIFSLLIIVLFAMKF